MRGKGVGECETESVSGIATIHFDLCSLLFYSTANYTSNFSSSDFLGQIQRDFLERQVSTI